MDAPPVFLVGPREGVVMLASLLDAHPELSCSGGGPFLSALTKAVRSAEDDVAVSGYPDQYWFSSLAAFFAAAQEGRTKTRGKHRWVEASGEHLPVEVLDKLFPQAQIVHVLPRGWAAARRRRVGTTAAARWARVAQRAGTHLGRRRYRAVQLDDLLASPTRVYDDVLGFLNEPRTRHAAPAREIVLPESADETAGTEVVIDLGSLQHSE